jgi:thiamine-phosphate pyrophosphorylase
LELVVISNDRPVENEISILIELFEQGLEVFHIRKPDFAEEEMEQYIMSIPEEYWDYLILHSHYDLAYKYELFGVHCGIDNDDLNHSFKSSSCNSIKDLQQIKNKLVNYTLLGPVFDSISKSDQKSSFSKEDLTVALKKPRQNGIFAFGGVNENKIEQCAEMEFNGVALLGAIWKSKHPISVFKNIRDKCLRLG